MKRMAPCLPIGKNGLRFLLLLFAFSLLPSHFFLSALAQPTPVVPSTAYTRYLLRSTNANDARWRLGISAGLTNDSTMLSVQTINDLRGLSVSNGLASVFVSGYNAPGDGGGGQFDYYPTSALDDDGGLIISPVSAPTAGRWQRVILDPAFIPVRWWGPTVTRTNIARAINAASTNYGGGTIVLPGTNFMVSLADGPIYLTNSFINIVGDVGCALTIDPVGLPTNYTLFAINNATNISLANFTVNGYSASGYNAQGVSINNASNLLFYGLTADGFHTMRTNNQYVNWLRIGTNTASVQVFDQFGLQDSIRGYGAVEGYDCRPAIRLALQNGLRAYFPKGSWSIDAEGDSDAYATAYIAPPSNAMIEADPSAVITVQPATNALSLLIPAAPKAMTNAYCIFNIPAASTNVTFRGGTWIGYLDPNTNLYHGGTWGHCIRSEATALLLENMTVKEFRKDAVSISGGGSVLITGCRISRCYNNHIAVTGARNVLIQGCELGPSLTIDDDFPEAGIDVEPNPGQSVSGVIVQANRFVGNETGIYVSKGGGEKPWDILIANNWFLTNQAFGMRLVNASNVVVTGNIIASTVGDQGATNTYGRGIYGENLIACTFNGNTIKGSTNYGVHLILCTNLLVGNNTSVGNTNYGMVVSMNRHSAITANTFDQNKAAGLYIGDCEGLTVTGNQITRNGEAGLSLYRTTHSVFSGNRVAENSQTTDQNDSNIELRDRSSWNTFSGNIVKKSAVLLIGTATGGGASSIVLSTNANSSVDNMYNESAIRILAGTSIGESNVITAYDSASFTATVVNPWVLPPDGTSVYEISSVLRPRYGIRILAPTCLTNSIWANDLAYSGETASIQDGGTGTAGYLGDLTIQGKLTVEDELRVSNDLTVTNGHIRLDGGKQIQIYSTNLGGFFYILQSSGDTLYLNVPTTNDFYLRGGAATNYLRYKYAPAFKGQLVIYNGLGGSGTPSITWGDNMTNGIAMGFYRDTDAFKSNYFGVTVAGGAVCDFLTNAVRFNYSVRLSDSGILSAAYTNAVTDIRVRCGAGATAITLLDCDVMGRGAVLTIEDSNGIATATPIVITPNTGDTIDDSATYTLDANYQSVVLLSDGSNKWKVSAVYDPAPTFGALTVTNTLTASGAFIQPIDTLPAAAVDWSLGNFFYLPLTVNTNLTFSGATTGQIITIKATATGAFTITWPAITWKAASTPVQTASKTDFYTIIYDGSVYYGSASQNY